ncbi:MAG: hypothetical protein IJ112_00920 [Oscillospiraceae bacterium]|nr:hypothetical protein [Oscillospiraceae bacterium]
MKKILNGLFAAAVVAALLGAMVIAILTPRTRNGYENRPAVALPVFSAPDALSGAYQDTLESALHDQLPGAQRLEEYYQTGLSAVTLEVLMAESAARPDVYYQFNDLLLFHGDVVYAPVYPEAKLGEISRRAANLNGIISEHPELTFYVFYIEKDTDMDFETGARTGFSTELLSQLWLPDTQKAIFPVRSFEDFRQNFYRTDHHWNRFGSYAGYLQLLQLLGKSDPLRPTGTKHMEDDFCGAKAMSSGAGDYYHEPFDVYTFAFPSATVVVNGVGPADYGRQMIPWDKEEFGTVSYGGFYGFDFGEVAFHTENAGAGNLLVIGDSFDNAILKLLAGHFENLYAVDLRAYEEDTGAPFLFSEYVAAHEIDSVLFIGNIDYFLFDDFLVEG